MSNKEPLVSVIIPNYNYARFLKQRITSVLQQKFCGTMEVILQDDASTDDSRTIIESYREHPCVTHIGINSQNSGSPFKQWMKGISLARGTYIWIAESDDYAADNFLSTTLPLLEEHPKAILCFTGSYRVDSEGHRLRIDYDRWSKEQRNHPQGYRVLNGQEYIRHNLYWRAYIYNASGVLFRRTAALHANLQQCIALRHSGDWLFWTELARQGDIIEVYRKLNCFRYHAGSQSTRARRSGESLLEDMQVVAYIERCLPIDRYRQLIRHGALSKRIRRLQTGPEQRRQLLDALHRQFNCGPGCYFVERIHKFLSHFLPLLITEERERL